MSEQAVFGISFEISDVRQIEPAVRTAERRGFGFALFEEGTAFDPVELASYAGALTTSIGVVAAAAATGAEPYHLANRFSSLDWGTSGRAGWALTTAGPETNAVVETVRRLWDSWEDEALVADSAQGRFLDHEKLHAVDAETEFFRIRGPGLMPRPPQGQVPILGVDITIARATGEDLLGTRADAIVVPAARASAVPDEVLRVGTGTLRERFGLERPGNRYAA